MNKYSSLFIVLLALCTMISCLKFKTDFKIHNYHNKLASMLVKIKQTPTTDLKSLKQFVEEVEDIASKLVQEQEKHSEILEKMKGEVLGEKAFREKEVQDAIAAIDAAQVAIDAYNKSNSNSKDTRSEITAHILSLTNAKETVTKQREEENKEYVKTKTDMDSALELVNKLITKINTKIETAGTGTTNSINLEKLLKAATKFHDKIATDIQQLEKFESQQAEAYNVFINGYSKAMENLEKNKKILEDHIESMNKAVDSEKGILNQASSKEQRNNQLLESVINMFNQFVVTYNKASASRKEELDILKEILEIIKERFGENEYDKDLNQKLEDAKNGLGEYKNMTPLAAFEENHPKKIDDNDDKDGK